MTPEDSHAFQDLRPRIQALAYRMLGSVDEAEEVVSEVLLRWMRRDGPSLDPALWLERECLRVSMEALPVARSRRRSYVGPWLPEPLVGSRIAAGWGGKGALPGEVPTLSTLLALESLAPAERGAWVLREGPHLPYARMAAILERPAASCRSLVSRARRRLEEASAPAEGPGMRTPTGLRDRFLVAAGSGVPSMLEKALAPGVQLWSDGGGVAAAALRVIEGAERVARFVLELSLRARPGTAAVRAPVNDEPGILVLDRGRVTTVVALAPDDDGRVARVLLVRNPAKLTHARPPEGRGLPLSLEGAP